MTSCIGHGSARIYSFSLDPVSLRETAEKRTHFSCILALGVRGTYRSGIIRLFLPRRQVRPGSGEFCRGIDNTLRLWDIEIGREIQRFEGHEGAVHSVSFCPDGKYTLSESSDGTLRLWDVATGSDEVRCFKGHEGQVSSLCFSPDGRYALSEVRKTFFERILVDFIRRCADNVTRGAKGFVKHHECRLCVGHICPL